MEGGKVKSGIPGPGVYVAGGKWQVVGAMARVIYATGRQW